MSDDWSVGDLALCVSAPWQDIPDLRRRAPAAPRKGQLKTVEEVSSPHGKLALGFTDRAQWLYVATCFRKMHPLPEAEVIASKIGLPVGVDA